MSLIDELLIGLGFEYDDEGIDKFKEDIGKTKEILGALVKVVVSATTAITALTVASTRASDEQGKLADEIGESVENLDALQFALERSGGTADGMANSLRNLAIRASEASRGVGSGLEAFALLGISNPSLKSTGDLLLEISSRLKNLNKSKQIELADKLGIRDSIRLLQQGPDAIRELIVEAKSLGVTTAEDAKIAADFQDSLTNLWKIVKEISRYIARYFAPIIQKINNSFIDWWKSNKEIIEQNLPKWIENLTRVLKVMVMVFGIWLSMKIATYMLTLISLVNRLSISVLILNGMIALLPAIIFGVIAAIALLAEDAKVFFEGGQSFIGDMIKKYPKWGEKINGIAAVLLNVYDVLVMIKEGWEAIFEISKPVIDMIIDGWGEIFNLLSSDNLFDNFKLATRSFKDYLISSFNEIINNISNMFSNMWDSVLDMFKVKVLIPINDKIKIIAEFFGADYDVNILTSDQKKQKENENKPIGSSETFRNLYSSIKSNVNIDIKSLLKQNYEKLKLLSGTVVEPIISNISIDPSFSDKYKSTREALVPMSDVLSLDMNGLVGNTTHVQNNTGTVINNSIDRIEISVNDSNNSIETAEAIKSMLQQSFQDLNTAVDH